MDKYQELRLGHLLCHYSPSQWTAHVSWVDDECSRMHRMVVQLS